MCGWASTSAGRFPIWKWVRIDPVPSLHISRAKDSILGIRFVRWTPNVSGITQGSKGIPVDSAGVLRG